MAKKCVNDILNAQHESFFSSFSFRNASSTQSATQDVKRIWNNDHVQNNMYFFIIETFLTQSIKSLECTI